MVIFRIKYMCFIYKVCVVQKCLRYLTFRYDLKYVICEMWLTKTVWATVIISIKGSRLTVQYSRWKNNPNPGQEKELNRLSTSLHTEDPDDPWQHMERAEHLRIYPLPKRKKKKKSLIGETLWKRTRQKIQKKSREIAQKLRCLNTWFDSWHQKVPEDRAMSSP